MRTGAMEAMPTEAETSRSSARSPINIVGLESPSDVRQRKNKQHIWEHSDEASRFHKAECRNWSGGFDDRPCGAVARTCAGKIGLQGIRGPAPRLPDRGAAGKFSEKAACPHKR